MRNFYIIVGIIGISAHLSTQVPVKQALNQPSGASGTDGNSPVVNPPLGASGTDGNSPVVNQPLGASGTDGNSPVVNQPLGASGTDGNSPVVNQPSGASGTDGNSPVVNQPLGASGTDGNFPPLADNPFADTDLSRGQSGVGQQGIGSASTVPPNPTTTSEEVTTDSLLGKPMELASPTEHYIEENDGFDREYDEQPSNQGIPSSQAGDIVGAGDQPSLGKKFKQDNVYVSEEESKMSGHFMAYMVTVGVLVAVLYVAYHNKQRLMAYVLEGSEGRQRRRRANNGSSSPAYQKLENTVDEAMPSIGANTGKANLIY